MLGPALFLLVVAVVDRLVLAGWLQTEGGGSWGRRRIIRSAADDSFAEGDAGRRSDDVAFLWRPGKRGRQKSDWRPGLSPYRLAFHTGR